MQNKRFTPLEQVSIDKMMKAAALEGSMLSLSDDLLVLDDVHCADLPRLPLQMGFLLIGMCTSGSADFRLSGREHHIEKGGLLIALGDQVLEHIHCSPDQHYTLVLMSRAYAQDCVTGLNYLWPYLLYIMEHPVTPLTEKEQAWIMECYGLLRKRLQEPPMRYLRETIVALTRAFYFETCNLLSSRRPEPNTLKQRSYSIFDRFIRLLSQNCRRERSVEWYSSELCISPKHLSKVTKQVSGRTAGQWIATFVIVEAKTMLSHSSLSVKEIAQELNFPNQSFLGKYFKNACGMSPSEFRHDMASRG